MYQRFFTDTYVSKTIKNIIKNTNLHTLPTVQKGDYVVENCIYIYGRNIIKCKQSGELDENYIVVGTTNDKEYTPNITYNVQSRYGFYDTYTHIFLGRYLRQYRDIYGVDLLPFYNCFSYQTEQNFHLKQSKKEFVEGTETVYKSVVELVQRGSADYKAFLVPICFDKTYTVAIDSPDVVLMKPVLYDSLGPIQNTSGYGNYQYVHDLINTDPEQNEPYAKTYIKHGTQFFNPFTVKVPIENSFETYQTENGEVNTVDTSVANVLYNYSNSLYLMIQVSSTNKSSIVILEGDYTNKNGVSVVSCEDTQLQQSQVENMYLSKLSLLQINDGVSYPFSDRLIEYLVGAVVTPYEELYGNIEKLQDVLGLSHNEIYGVWDDLVRQKLFAYYSSIEDYIPLDDNGYLNKDIEKLLIQRGKM